MVWPVSGSSTGAKGGILVGQLGQAEVELLFFRLGLGFNGASDNRLARGDALKQNGRLGRADGVAGARVLEAHRHHDGACTGALDALAPIGMHGEEASDLFVAPGAWVLHFVARSQHARVDAQVHGLAPFVHGHLEGQGAKGRAVVGDSGHHFVAAGDVSGDGRHLGGRGQEVANRVE